MSDDVEKDVQPNVYADDGAEWMLEEETLFGEGRSFAPIEPNLIRNYGLKHGTEFLQRQDKNTAVMLLAVKIPDFTVLEHMFVTLAATDEQWQRIFRRMVIEEFTSVRKEIYDRAFALYQSGDFKGVGWLHRICMRADELYPLMNPDDQMSERALVKAAIKQRARRTVTPAQRRKKKMVRAKFGGHGKTLGGTKVGNVPPKKGTKRNSTTKNKNES
jgi:hypothetical protein